MHIDLRDLLALIPLMLISVAGIVSSIVSNVKRRRRHSN
jgi:hypothetical protein